MPGAATARLNRNIDARTGGPPQLSDLKASGSLEQDAAVKLLLWEKPAPAAGPAEGRVGVVVAKPRTGPRCETALRFRKTCVRLEDIRPGES